MTDRKALGGCIHRTLATSVASATAIQCKFISSHSIQFFQFDLTQLRDRTVQSCARVSVRPRGLWPEATGGALRTAYCVSSIEIRRLEVGGQGSNDKRPRRPPSAGRTDSTRPGHVTPAAVIIPRTRPKDETVHGKKAMAMSRVRNGNGRAASFGRANDGRTARLFEVLAVVSVSS